MKSGYQSLLGVGALLAFSASDVCAQDTVLDEITVSATKRETSSQDIPISINTTSGDAIAQYTYNNLEDLSATIPNFTMGEGVNNNFISMRGLTSGNDRSFEQSVGLFVDGVYAPRSRAYRSPFFDVERVEVLRGPQAVLFGLNSSAGAVSIITAKSRPGDGFTADFTAEYESEYSGTTFSAVIGGSPSETLGLRLAAEHLDSGDGYYTNLATNSDESTTDQTLVRLSAVWEPSDVVTIEAKVEVADFDVDGSQGELIDPSGTLDGDGTINWVRGQDASLFDIIVANDPFIGAETGIDQESTNVAVSLDYQLGEHTLTAVAGYMDLEWDLGIDLDASLIPLFDAGLYEEFEENSFELRLASPIGDKVEYIAGIYYQSYDLFNSQPNVVDRTLFLAPFGFPIPGFPFDLEWSRSTFDLESDMWSAFASATFNLNDSTRLTVGARYNDEDKSVSRGGEGGYVDTDGSIRPGDPTNPNDFPLFFPDLIGFSDDRNSTNFMPEVALQWDYSDNLMFYGKVGKSAKSGGFASSGQLAPESVEYDDEEVLGYEAGLKSSLAGGAAELNLAIFRTEYDDLQVNAFDPATAANLVQNAAKVISQGLEIDARWAATEWLTLGASIGFLDAEYDEWSNARCPASITPAGVEFCDFAGEPTPFSPDFSGTLTAAIEAPINDNLNFLFGTQVTYSDQYFTDSTLDPVGIQDSYTKLAARIGIGGADDRWNVSIVGKNLTDEAVLGSILPFLATIGYVQPPRTVSLQARYSFGE